MSRATELRDQARKEMEAITYRLSMLHISLATQAKGLESISTRLAALDTIVRDWAEAARGGKVSQ